MKKCGELQMAETCHSRLPHGRRAFRSRSQSRQCIAGFRGEQCGEVRRGLLRYVCDEDRLSRDEKVRVERSTRAHAAP